MCEKHGRRLQGHRHGDRNNLGTNGVRQFPVETIILVVKLDHGGRRLPPRAVALQAGSERNNRLRQEQGATRRWITLNRELLLVGMRAEDLNDVGFPIDSSIAQVGWVQGRFFVV